MRYYWGLTSSYVDFKGLNKKNFLSSCLEFFFCYFFTFKRMKKIDGGMLFLVWWDYLRITSCNKVICMQNCHITSLLILKFYPINIVIKSFLSSDHFPLTADNSLPLNPISSINKSLTNLNDGINFFLLLIHGYLCMAETKEGNEEIRIICHRCTLQHFNNKLHSIMWNKLNFFRDFFPSDSSNWTCQMCECVCVN